MSRIAAHTSTAAQGILWNQLQEVTDNLALSSKQAYKEKKTHFLTFSKTLQNGEKVYYTKPGPTNVDMRDGDFIETGNPLHLALRGKGFFVVGDSANPSYTRDGAFTMDDKRKLVTLGGLPVLAKGGQEITLPRGQIIRIEPDGTIIVDGARTPFKIDLVEFEKVGEMVTDSNGNRRTNEEPKESTESRVQAEGLEESNINPIMLMAEMQIIKDEFMRLIGNNSKFQRQDEEDRANLMVPIRA